MKQRQQDGKGIAERAAQWIDAVQAGDVPPAAFVAWLKESPRHIEEVLLVSATIHVLSDAFSEQSPESRQKVDASRLKEMSAANVIPLGPTPAPDGMPTHRRFVARWRVVGLAASIVAIALLAAVALRHAGGELLYTTKAGEQHAVELEDGSVVYLNTASRLAVLISPHAREMRLLEGEALFKVRHDANRPFRVQTPDALILAVGTEFNVYRRPTGTQVSVIEGVVQVSQDAADKSSQSKVHISVEPTRLAAGEEAIVTPRGNIKRHKPADPSGAIAWRQRRLVFDDNTLRDIAVEFNRYSPRVTVQVDNAVSAHRFSGTFDADSPESLGRALATDPSLRIEARSSQIVIRAGNEGTKPDVAEQSVSPP